MLFLCFFCLVGLCDLIILQHRVKCRRCNRATPLNVLAVFFFSFRSFLFFVFFDFFCVSTMCLFSTLLVFLGHLRCFFRFMSCISACTVTRVFFLCLRTYQVPAYSSSTRVEPQGSSCRSVCVPYFCHDYAWPGVE